MVSPRDFPEPPGINVVKDDLLRALNKFYDLNDPSFNSLNTAFYVLIPKNEAPTQISHYRPISLIHVFAKLLSKILASRLQPRMDELVPPAKAPSSVDEASKIISYMYKT
jgi:hypothetical protein